jgi:beta-phosphoglucomutase
MGPAIRPADGLALIFDMDGVIVHSNPLHSETWKAFNRRFGLETTPAMISSMFGKRNDDIVREWYGETLSEKEVARRGADKERLYREMAAGKVGDMLMPGLREFLGRHRSAPMAVASNAEPENIDFVLDEAALWPYFRIVLNGHMVTRPKPFPDIYLVAAERLGAKPENCVVFEDSYSGVEAARAANMRVVGIRSSHSEIPGCDFAADNFLGEDLETWLSKQSPVA